MTQPNLKNNGLLQFSSVRFGSVRVITPTCSICSSLSFLMKLYCHLWLVSDIDFLPFIFSPPSLLTLFYLSVCHFCLLFVVLLFWFDCSLRLFFCAHFVHSSCVFSSSLLEANCFVVYFIAICFTRTTWWAK